MATIRKPCVWAAYDTCRDCALYEECYRVTEHGTS